MPETQRFRASFVRWARRVRSRLLLTRVLSGAALGSFVGAFAAALSFFLRHGELRPWAALFGLVGAFLGAAYAARRRWSDGDVALYLDARLESAEAIATAVEIEREHADELTPVHTNVLARASEALEHGDPKRARPRTLALVHALVPVGLGLVVWLSLRPLPPRPASPPPPPGSELVRLAKVGELDAIVALDKLDGRDPLQRERLKRIAEEAKKLRADLEKGIEKRDAQSRIAQLRDEIAAEKPSLGDQKNRAGLEAAVAKLSNTQETKDSAKALGNGDLVEFDRQMHELANKVEREHREAAKLALAEAKKAARERGASDVARSLEEQQKLFAKREADAQALRELADALKGKLSEEALKDLEEFGQNGSPEAQKRLADAVSDALGKLRDDEKKRLAENLKKRVQTNADVQPLTKEQLDALAKKLASPEGKKELEEQLKELARQDPGKDADQQKRLDDADRGGAELGKKLGGLPLPSGESPSRSPSDKLGGRRDNSKGPGQGGPGSKHDEGTGNHAGKTGKVEGGELRAKADSRLLPGAPLAAGSPGRAPGRAGETANQRGTGALGSVGPTEIGGVERSEVPEEYREQVGRYFEP